MAMPGWAALKVASRGTSHFSATASTETILHAFRAQSAVALGHAVHVREDALYLLQVGLAAAVDAHAAMAALEERHLEMLLQLVDAVGDGGRGDAKLLGGADEALVAGGGLEEAQAFERGQEQHVRTSRRPDMASRYAAL